jgi:hypothetical protein
MIDIEGKFLFIHIPRTNGSELCNWYYNSVLHHRGIRPSDFINYLVGDQAVSKHFTYAQYARHFAHLDLDNFYKLSIIRNPFDTTVSTYWMHVKLKTSFIANFKINSFSEYVKFLDSVKSNTETDVFQSLRTIPYIDQCHDVNIIRYENYNDDAQRILGDIGEIEVAKRYDKQKLHNEYDSRYGNSERPTDYREMYNEYTKDLVGKLFMWDLKVFEYDF